MDDADVGEAEWSALLDEPPSLCRSDPRLLNRHGRLALLVRVQEMRARLASAEAELLVCIAGEGPRQRQVLLDDPDGAGRTVTVLDEDVDLIAAVTHRSLGVVRRDVATARALATCLPSTRQQLAQGRISPEHAEAIARTAQGLPAHLLPRFEARVLARAAELTSHETAARARRIRARLDARGEEQRRRRARAHIGVRVWAMDDGLACLHAVLPFAQAARVHAALEARVLAAPYEPDLSMGEARASALVDAVCDGVMAGGPDDSSDAPAAAVDVQVVVDLATLLGMRGLRDHAEGDGFAMMQLGSGPAEPVALGALRELLDDPDVPVTLRRLVTDPISGDLLDRGRTAYRVGGRLRAFLTARDATCSFPHCLRAARSCDADHVKPWGAGGRTDRDNLVSLCRRHHVLKTHAAWTLVERRPSGAAVWRAPDGRTYVSAPLAAHRAFGSWRPD